MLLQFHLAASGAGGDSHGVLRDRIRGPTGCHQSRATIEVRGQKRTFETGMRFESGAFWPEEEPPSVFSVPFGMGWGVCFGGHRDWVPGARTHILADAVSADVVTYFRDGDEDGAWVELPGLRIELSASGPAAGSTLVALRILGLGLCRTVVRNSATLDADGLPLAMEVQVHRGCGVRLPAGRFQVVYEPWRECSQPEFTSPSGLSEVVRACRDLSQREPRDE